MEQAGPCVVREHYPRYYFDTSDGDTFVKDEEGITLRGVEATRLQAQGALADMARDVVPGTAQIGP